MRKLLLLPIALFLFTAVVTSQEQPAAQRMSLDLVDMPNAVTLPQGVYAIGLRMYPNGGVLTDFSIGILDRLYGRIFYGGENLIGTGTVNWDPRVGIDFRVRAIDETLFVPAVAVGVNTQGFGGFQDNINRYLIKSRGIYAVASRNYATTLGDVSIHGGVNYSLERDDDDKDLNFFTGINALIRNKTEIILEYDAAVNDNEETSFGTGNGYFNAGVRFFVSDRFFITAHFRDLFENTDNTKGFGREIRLEYRDTFKK
ncbi:hypothetical protein ACFL6L_04210 [candidate division KSB1 bacterium]